MVAPWRGRAATDLFERREAASAPPGLARARTVGEGEKRWGEVPAIWPTSEFRSTSIVAHAGAGGRRTCCNSPRLGRPNQVSEFGRIRVRRHSAAGALDVSAFRQRCGRTVHNRQVDLGRLQTRRVGSAKST
jgi:hypothetical protein